MYRSDAQNTLTSRRVARAKFQRPRPAMVQRKFQAPSGTSPKLQTPIGTGPALEGIQRPSDRITLSEFSDRDERTSALENLSQGLRDNFASISQRADSTSDQAVGVKREAPATAPAKKTTTARNKARQKTRRIDTRTGQSKGGSGGGVSRSNSSASHKGSSSTKTAK